MTNYYLEIVRPDSIIWPNFDNQLQFSQNQISSFQSENYLEALSDVVGQKLKNLFETTFQKLPSKFLDLFLFKELDASCSKWIVFPLNGNTPPPEDPAASASAGQNDKNDNEELAKKLKELQSELERLKNEEKELNEQMAQIESELNVLSLQIQTTTPRPQMTFQQVQHGCFQTVQTPQWVQSLQTSGGASFQENDSSDQLSVLQYQSQRLQNLEQRMRIAQETSRTNRNNQNLLSKKIKKIETKLNN